MDRPVRILVAEDDKTARLVVSAIVESAGYEVVEAEDGQHAWEILSGDPGLRIILADWVMPNSDGLELCRRIRSMDDHSRYVIVLTGRGRRQDVLEAMEAGADDVLVKPVSPELLTRYLQGAERAIRGRTSASHDTEQVLRQAAAAGSGEVVVRNGQQVARVFFHDGKVAWLDAPGHPSALQAVLPGAEGRPADEAGAIIEECRRTGKPFDEIVVQWGLLREDEMRSRLRAWMRAGLQSITAIVEPDVLFLPGRRTFAGRHTFALKEVLSAAPGEGTDTGRRVSLPVPRGIRCLKPDGPCDGCGDNVGATVDALLGIDGVLGAVVLHANTGQAIGAGGAEIDPDVLVAQVRLLRAVAPTDEVQDVVVNGADTYFMTHATPCNESLVSVLVSRATGPLGLVRGAVNRVARGIRPRISIVEPMPADTAAPARSTRESKSQSSGGGRRG